MLTKQYIDTSFPELPHILMLKHQQLKDNYNRITNAYWRMLSINSQRQIDWFGRGLAAVLRAYSFGDEFTYRESSGYITVYYNGGEIASINLRNNSINFRNQSATMVTKVMKFNRLLTPQRAARYVLTYGYTKRNHRPKKKSDNWIQLTPEQSEAKSIFKSCVRFIQKDWNKRSDLIRPNANTRIRAVMKETQKHIVKREDAYYTVHR